MLIDTKLYFRDDQWVNLNINTEQAPLDYMHSIINDKDYIFAIYSDSTMLRVIIGEDPLFFKPSFVKAYDNMQIIPGIPDIPLNVAYGTNSQTLIVKSEDESRYYLITPAMEYTWLILIKEGECQLDETDFKINQYGGVTHHLSSEGLLTNKINNTIDGFNIVKYYRRHNTSIYLTSNGKLYAGRLIHDVTNFHVFEDTIYTIENNNLYAYQEKSIVGPIFTGIIRMPLTSRHDTTIQKSNRVKSAR